MKSDKQILQLVEQKIYSAISQRLKRFIKPNLTLNHVDEINLELVKKN